MHYSVVVPYAALHDVYRAHWAVAFPTAGNHPQFPSVPKIQLACSVVIEHPVIATQVVPLVVHNGEIC